MLIKLEEYWLNKVEDFYKIIKTMNVIDFIKIP